QTCALPICSGQPAPDPQRRRFRGTDIGGEEPASGEEGGGARDIRGVKHATFGAAVTPYCAVRERASHSIPGGCGDRRRKHCLHSLPAHWTNPSTGPPHEVTSASSPSPPGLPSLPSV